MPRGSLDAGSSITNRILQQNIKLHTVKDTIDHLHQQGIDIQGFMDYQILKCTTYTAKLWISQRNSLKWNTLQCCVSWVVLSQWRSVPKGQRNLILTHWGRVTHICVSKLSSIVSDNGLSPGRRQAIIWTNAGLLLIGPLGINFSEILIEIHTFSFKKLHFKISSGKCRPFCLGLNVLRTSWTVGSVAVYWTRPVTLKWRNAN